MTTKLAGLWKKAAVAGVLGLGACGPVEPEKQLDPPDTTKVGFIYVGPIGDYGWTKSHEDARLYLENFAADVDTTYAESVTDAPKVIDDMVAAGNSIIFTTSYDYLHAAEDAAKRHPGVTFLNCSGFKKGERFGTYFSRVEEAEYLAGMVAGRMTNNDKIGVVAAMKNYEQVMHINAFTLGVQAVNPDAQVFVRWVGFWFDPAREAIGTKELIEHEGVDIIKGATDTSIPYEEAAKLDVLSISHDNKDGCSKAPDHCIVASYYNWGPLYVKLLEEVRGGTYPKEGRIDYVSMADMDVHDISSFHSRVPQAVRDEVMAVRQKILAGAFDVFQGPLQFQGPISSNTAAESIAEGESLTDEHLICAKSFVQGITEIPGPACGSDADCVHEILGVNKLTCVSGMCVAPDLAGCPQ